MRRYLRLYRKELRFLAGPGIVLVVLAAFLRLMNLLPYESPPVEQYIMRPLYLLFSIDSLRIVYGLLFFYALIHEHVTKTRYQLLMLPIRRWCHIFGKLTAVMTWVAVYVLTAGLMWRFSVALQQGKPWVSFHLLVIIMGGLLSETACLVSLVTAGYTVGLVFRRMPYLAGTVTMIAGYTLVIHLRTFVYQYFAQNLPYSQIMSLWGNWVPLFRVIFPAVTALIFVVPAFFLYEKSSEV